MYLASLRDVMPHPHPKRHLNVFDPFASPPKVDNTEELKEMADLAERADGNSLGIGHPAAPEPIHEDDPSWMAERSRGKGGQGRGGTRRLVLVLHGLEGSSTAPLTKRFSSVYTRNG